jgi:epsilon-lactone hydrolase
VREFSNVEDFTHGDAHHWNDHSREASWWAPAFLTKGKCILITQRTSIRIAFAAILIANLGTLCTQRAFAADQSSVETSDRATAAALQSLNAEKGPRHTPERFVPVPSEVSPELAALIAAAPRDGVWNADPQTAQAWHEHVAKLAAFSMPGLAAVKQSLGVSITKETIGGVPVFICEPREIKPARAEKTLLHFHGGGFVLSPGEAGTLEAVLMAAYGGYRVVSVDYRMPPDHPYPAALNDALAAYRGLLLTRPAESIAVFGSSAGGNLAISLLQRAKRDGLPMAAALAPLSPWIDLTEVGDTYRTLEGVDNVLVSYRGYASRAATLYAGGLDLKDARVSPYYGSFAGLPPAILTSGTRDVLLSATVLTYWKFRKENIETSLQIVEGLSHVQYLFAPQAPETKLLFAEIGSFFDRHLKAGPKSGN